jgi:NAD(P)-dependent dehydrogenase (short-subunit alcohol dehydrogenase family)
MGILDGKVALVTGSASGIGRASALLMAAEGAKVVVSDVNNAGGNETVAQIRASGGDAIFSRADVSQSAQVAALIDEALNAYGKLDCAFNNAGVGGQLSQIHEKTEEEWDAVIAVNLTGVWLCMKYEIPALIANGGGAIVNMASVAGLQGFRYASAYSASKHGVIGITRTAALEYAKKNIRVNAVCPYFTDTPMVREMIETAPSMERMMIDASPMRRMGTVEEIAEGVVWLCSEKSSYITGHALPLDGGITVN